MNVVFRIHYTLVLVPILFACPWQRLMADRILLKNGRSVENVKTSIEKTFVKLRYENGKIETLQKSEIKSLKILAVEWKPVGTNTQSTSDPSGEQIAHDIEEEKARVAEAAERGDEFTPRAEEEMVSPWGNFARGLIPGYSGLYKTENTGRAVAFSVIETIAFLNFVDVMTAKKTSHQIDAFDIGISYFSTSSTTIGAGGNLLLAANFTNAYGYESGLSGRTISEQLGNNKAKAALANKQATAAGILGFLLIADAVSSYFAAETWNEGTYGGEKSDDNFVRPTKASSRLLRSAFLPGWGQVYSGEKVKGYSWLAGGLGLFGYVVSTEIGVQRAYSNYKTDGLFAANSAPILGQILGLTTESTSPTQNLGARVAFAEAYQAEARDGFETAVEKRNQAWSLYGVFWAINLIDAYFFSGKNMNQVGSLRILPEYSLQPVAILGNQLQNEHKLNFTLSYTY